MSDTNAIIDAAHRKLHSE